MNTESKIAFICVTKNAMNLAIKIKSLINDGEVYITNKLLNNLKENKESLNVIDGKLSDFMPYLFKHYDYLIFIMATGIVVRSIANEIKSKFHDPAIIVIDEKGKNVISLLSGHMGGANEMTNYISHILNANPVITTATDVNEKTSLDMIAKKLNAHIDNFKENVKEVNSLIVNGGQVGVFIDGNYDIDKRGLIIIENLNEFHRYDKLDKIIYITNKQDTEIKDSRIIKVIPKDIVIGMGCRKDTPYNDINNSLDDLLSKFNIDKNSIAKIGSVEVKKNEKGIIQLAKKLKVPFKIITLEEIKKIEDKFQKSEFVKKSIGVYCVAEPVAYILSNNNLIVEKHKYKGITFSIGRISL